MFSIHNICKAGLSLGKQPGDWYGPQSMLQALKQVNRIDKFKIAVCSDGNIVLDKIIKKLEKGNAVFVGVPLQLGITSVNPEYLDSIKQAFALESFVGFAGGQGAGSFYFTGIINRIEEKDPYLLYLDPHTTQPACVQVTDETESSFFCPEIKTLLLSKICTAVAVGFYLRSFKDYDVWLQ
jgi:cysteine protease ATG4